MATTSEPTNTYKTALMYKPEGASDWEVLVPIKTTPDLGKTPDRLETTNLSQPAKTYIDGIEGDDEGLDFTANYILDDYRKLYALKGKTLEYAVWYDDSTIVEEDYTPTGALGKWSWKGQLTVYPTASETNSVRELQISITVGSTIIFEDPEA